MTVLARIGFGWLLWSLAALLPLPQAHATWYRSFLQTPAPVQTPPSPYPSSRIPWLERLPSPRPDPSPLPTASGLPTVAGPADFQARVENALSLLALAPRWQEYVSRHLLLIAAADHSGASVRTRTFFLNPSTASANPYYVASIIVHDACHVDLYLQGRTYYGQEAEMYCLALQRQTLLDLGAPAYLVSYLDYLKGTSWWEVPYSARNW